MNRVKIATFNVNSIRSRLHIVIPWLQRIQPDVLCMQETKVNNDQFPKDSFHEIDYKIIYSGSSSGRNGVALASREEPLKYTVGLPSKPQDDDRIISAYFSRFQIVNTYIPQGFNIDDPRYQYKLEWFQRLHDYFKDSFSMEDNLVWCGDLNIAPENIDVSNPKTKKNHVCFHEDAQQAFRNVTSLGFIDVFRKHHPNEENQYSFFDYRVPDALKRNIGWRVDHILTSPLLAEKSSGAYIDRQPRTQEKPSDHTPVLAEFIF
jgi:exodeoxyribonuclease-3